MNRVPPRVVVPGTTKRDAVIAVVTGLLVLAFLGYGIMQMGKPGKSNELTGVIVSKEFTPQKERQITFSGRKLKSAREIDGEYLCKVRVAPQNRIYEVPVEKDTYEAKKIGDKLTFLRPESEQE